MLDFRGPGIWVGSAGGGGLSGEGGVGKSWLALAVASGRPVAGLNAVAGRALYDI